MASMLFATSCSEEEVLSQSTGNEVKVTFTTELRNDVKSRTVGDNANGIDLLQFAVYDESGNYLDELKPTIGSLEEATITVDGTTYNTKKTTITVTLVKGQTYSFAFWAQNAAYATSGAYTFNPETAEVTIDYDKLSANQREADAFFGQVLNHKVTGTFTMDVTLKRPFAQVNFLTSAEDIQNARKAGFDPDESSIIVKNVANTLNVLTGEVKNIGDAEVTFGSAELLYSDGNIETTTIADSSEEWKYLATAYFLPNHPTGETKINATMKIKAEDAGKAETEIVATDITAQRNYRTNIYGDLLTSDGTFNVIVDPSFAGDHNTASGVYDVTGTSLSDLLTTNVALEGDLVYNISGYSNTDVTVNIPNGTAASSLTFNFTDIKDDATMTIANESGASYAGTVTLKNPSDKTISQLTVSLPDAHVILAQGNYTNVTASTSSSTLVIAGGATVGDLTVNKGNVEVEEGGELENVSRSENNEDLVTYVSYENEANIPTDNYEGSGITYVPAEVFDVSFVQVGKDSYEIGNLLGLEMFRNAVNNGNTYSGKTVKLITNIDLANEQWISVGTEKTPFTGEFDGNNHTIKNLSIVEEEAKEGKAYIGFFGYANNATIKNVTFENVNLNIACLDIDHSQGHIGAVAGSLEGTSTIENVTVKGDVFVEATVTANGASRVAVVAGGNEGGNVTMKNVHVEANEGSYLKANNNVGALAGQLQGKNVFENCSSNIDVTGTKFFAGGLIGLAAGDSQFTDCHTTGDVAITAGREGRANDHYRVGGIAGGWADGKTKVCTLTNCSYTGTISGTNADGSVAGPFDYAGYVGRGYTLTNCAGSKVVIDGVEYVQAYNDTYGIYAIDGCIEVATADELIKALETNYNVKLAKDIKIDPASMSNAYGTTGINVKSGQDIDGGNHTLDIKGAGGTWDSGICARGGLIKDLTVTGSFRGIFIREGNEPIKLENVTLKNVTYTISVDQANNQTVEAYNSSFYGWTSYAATIGSAKFENCTFGEGNGYAFCRPYAPTTFVGCEFEEGYKVDPKATVTFENCKLNGIAITAENVAELVTDADNVAVK